MTFFYWLADLALSFTGHAMIGFLVLLLAGLVLRGTRAGRWLRAGGAVGAVLMLIIVVFGHAHGRIADPSAEGETFTVLSFNIEASSLNHEEKLAFLRDENADIVLIQEANPRWWETMQALADLYPYRRRGGPIGVFVLSKYPFAGDPRFIRVEFPGDVPRPPYLKEHEGVIRGLRVPVMIAGQPVTLLNFHATKPDRLEKFVRRNRDLARLGEWLEDTEGPLILAGDFNSAPMALTFQSLVRRHHLKGLMPLPWLPLGTWPEALAPIGFQVDHVLFRGSLTPRAYHVGPAVGSNHRPLHVTFALSLET